VALLETPNAPPSDTSIRTIKRGLKRATSPAESGESATCGWALLHFGHERLPASHQTRYFARFIATVGTRARDFATAVADNLKEMVNHEIDDEVAKNKAAGAKMPIVRYSGELTLFRVGLGQYLEVLGHAFECFDARTIDLLFILMQCSGKFVSNVIAAPFYSSVKIEFIILNIAHTVADLRW
jgi:hypothetical protein